MCKTNCQLDSILFLLVTGHYFKIKCHIKDPWWFNSIEIPKTFPNNSFALNSLIEKFTFPKQHTAFHWWDGKNGNQHMCDISANAFNHNINIGTIITNIGSISASRPKSFSFFSPNNASVGRCWTWCCGRRPFPRQKFTRQLWRSTAAHDRYADEFGWFRGVKWVHSVCIPFWFSACHFTSIALFTTFLCKWNY